MTAERHTGERDSWIALTAAGVRFRRLSFLPGPSTDRQMPQTVTSLINNQSFINHRVSSTSPAFDTAQPKLLTCTHGSSPLGHLFQICFHTPARSFTMARVWIHGFMCERCNYRWAPRGAHTEETSLVHEPKACPNCKSRYWNRPRQVSRLPENRAALYQPKPLDQTIADLTQPARQAQHI